MSTKRSNRNTLAVVLIGAGAVAVAGLGMFAAGPNANRVPQQESRKTDQSVTVTVKPDGEQQVAQVKVFTPKLEDDGFTFEETTVDVPSGQDPMLFACRQLIKQFTSLPEGSDVLSVKVAGKQATVDLSEAVSTGMGSAEEGGLVNGILTTLGQFKEIEEVKFTVAGAPLETLGHLELDGPQPVQRP